MTLKALPSPGNDPALEPPEHLTEASAAWWRHVMKGYDLDPHHVLQLRTAAEAWDRGQAARELIDRDGPVVDGRYGPRAHPAIAIERDAKKQFLAALRALDLDGESLPTPHHARRGR